MKLLGLVRRSATGSARCSQLLVWICAWVYVCARRRALTASVLVLFLAGVVLLLQWGVICLDVQSWWHVHRVCLDYKRGAVEGSMCAPLCLYNDIESLSCQSFYMGKEAVFAATWNSKHIVFKSPKKSSMAEPEALFWVDYSNNIHYPTESEFEHMIENNIVIKFNISANEEFIKSVSQFHYHHPNRTKDRFTEMRNLWFLLQDNEYLAMQLYEKYNIFPKLIGSCGSFYTMERMKTVTRFSHLVTTDESVAEWQRRVHIAILILNFLNSIESATPEPLYLCDMKLNHFGITEKFDKVKYLDLDSVHPKSVANKIVSAGSECEVDEDCDFFDCRSHCDRRKKTCIHPVANNNLQMVCEKIFLGWAMSGRVLMPGLLIGPHTPHSLVDLLKLCANPEREPGIARSPTSKEIHNKIYNILLNIKTALSNH